MFLYYVLNFFKKGDTIQGGALFKEIRYVDSGQTTCFLGTTIFEIQQPNWYYMSVPDFW